MGYKLTKGEGQDFEKVPAGNHRAVIVSVCELGTHTEKGFKAGSPDVQRFKFQVVYELLDEPKGGGKDCWVIGHVYTATNYAEAPIMKVVAAALRRPIKKDEEPDMEQIVGQVVLVNVVHEPGQSDPDKIYDKVKDVSPLPAGMKNMTVKPMHVPEYHALGTYVEYDWHPRVFGAKVSEKIAASVEAKRGFKPPPPSAPLNATKPQEVADLIEEAKDAPQTPTPDRSVF